MSSFANEFDFVDDDSGGRFVAAGSVVNEVRSLLARGELETASRIYEELGSSSAEALMAEARMASHQTRKQMAEVFKRARDFANAAILFELSKQDSEAARMFEQAGNFASAAAAFQRAGDLASAGAAYERVGQVDTAIALYRQAGKADSVAECLVRQGRMLEAAAQFRELGNVHAEAQVLGRVALTSPERPRAVLRLAEMMEAHKQVPRAVNLLMETLRGSPEAARNVELQTELARLLELTGRAEDAAKLRARVKQLGASMPAAPAAAGPGATRAAAPAADGADAPGGGEAYGYLKAIPIFAELSLQDMRDLYRVCHAVALLPGRPIIEEGKTGNGLYVLIEGEAEVRTGSGAETRVLNRLGPGAWAGEISLVGDAPTSASVVTRTPVKALHITREAFHHYVYSHDAAALRIYRLFTANLADRVRALSARA